VLHPIILLAVVSAHHSAIAFADSDRAALMGDTLALVYNRSPSAT
jgi:hypothetical protein